MQAMMDSPHCASRALPYLAGMFGILLLVLGTKLKQFEQQREVVASLGKSH
jgi:hypothetical protein